MLDNSTTTLLVHRGGILCTKRLRQIDPFLGTDPHSRSLLRVRDVCRSLPSRETPSVPYCRDASLNIVGYMPTIQLKCVLIKK